MIHGFPIDFVRQALEQTLLEQHIVDPTLFGGKNQVNIFSLYEQLAKGDDIDRYVENLREITDQQNKTALILNGVLLAPTNPTITNLYSCTNIPMEWVCSLRCALENRDQALETLNNLIEELKGSKVDIAELKCVSEEHGTAYKPFVVGTIGHNEGAPKLENGDYIGDVDSITEVIDKVYDLEDKYIDINNGADWLYCGYENKIKVVRKEADHPFIFNDPNISSYSQSQGKVIANVILETESNSYTRVPLYDKNVRAGYLTLMNENEEETDVECDTVINSVELENGHVVFYLTCTCDNVYGNNFDDVTWADIDIYSVDYTFVEDDGTHPEIIFPPEHVDFKKYKLSMSCEAIRCDEPYTLNSEKYVKISFGGSATLTDYSVLFGNDLVKVCIEKYGIKLQSANVVYSSPVKYWLEPLEMPSSNDPNTRINQLVSNNFKSNTHTDAIALTLQYTFLLDTNIKLLDQWFEYGRYGTTNVGANSSSSNNAMSPNLIYKVTEYWSYWGNVKNREIKTKISNSIDIEDTESDTMTVGVVMQIQGDND